MRWFFNPSRVVARLLSVGNPSITSRPWQVPRISLEQLDTREIPSVGYEYPNTNVDGEIVGYEYLSFPKGGVDDPYYPLDENREVEVMKFLEKYLGPADGSSWSAEGPEPRPAGLPEYITFYLYSDGASFYSLVKLDEFGDPEDDNPPPPTLTFDQLFLPEGGLFDGTLASFEREGAVAEQLFARVSWGDGTTDSAIVVQNKDGSFSVKGKHTWNVDGTYLTVVHVVDLEDNDPNPFVYVDARPAFVFQLGEVDSAQAIPRESLTVTGTSFTTSGPVAAGDAAGTDTISVSGYATYDLVYDTIERNRWTHRTVSGRVVFETLEAVGEFDMLEAGSRLPSSAFEVVSNRFRSTEGEIETTATEQYADLDEVYTRTGSSTQTWASLDKSVDFVTGDYTLIYLERERADWRDVGTANRILTSA